MESAFEGHSIYGQSTFRLPCLSVPVIGLYPILFASTHFTLTTYFSPSNLTRYLRVGISSSLRHNSKRIFHWKLGSTSLSVLLSAVLRQCSTGVAMTPLSCASGPLPLCMRLLHTIYPPKGTSVTECDFMMFSDTVPSDDTKPSVLLCFARQDGFMA